MALSNGYRFTVSMDEAFPFGLYALGVTQANDYDAAKKSSTPTRDKVTNDLVWNVACIDRDPETRQKQITVKVLAPHMPTLPEEIVPDSGIRPVAFDGIRVTAYVDSKTGRLAYSFRATGVQAQGRRPRGAAPEGQAA
jgi:hypothetical protein